MCNKGFPYARFHISTLSVLGKEVSIQGFVYFSDYDVVLGPYGIALAWEI